ncbi:hypothetical protein E2562_027710 [Oryza meyeriana var. granulata]|uniref:Uncharacterized protein n=1 Tax=Oryza meyeriana var. granulata TaxID=110450 RepID=A0A6G1CS27_9ORYZ|nr:hypothetical protein E2562_027710 [Oryza meyeriana var. granulata]
MAPWKGGPRRRSSLSSSHALDRASWTWLTWDVSPELNHGNRDGGKEEEDGMPKRWGRRVPDPSVR